MTDNPELYVRIAKWLERETSFRMLVVVLMIAAVGLAALIFVYVTRLRR